MSLSLDLKLRMTQQLVMTPQLQMAIRLLQMSSLELTEYLQEEIDKNPLLECSDDDGGDEEFNPFQAVVPEATAPAATIATHEGATHEGEHEYQDDGYETTDNELASENRLAGDLNMDASWSDIYIDTSGADNYDNQENSTLESIVAHSSTLIDHLIWQLGVSALNERERVIGETIIDAIDENGYLPVPLEHIAEIAQATVDEVEDALVLIQSFEPAGVGARSLAECLKLQLKNLGLARAPYTRLLDHLDDLARKDFRKLGRLMKLNEDDLSEVVSVIQSLNPKPGLAFGSDQTRYVIPDVFVRKQGGEWILEVNPEMTPRLRISRMYQEFAGRNLPERDKRYLLENARSAQWLIKSLEQRTSTIYRVAESIVRFQRDFLEYGQEYLKPLILKDVADDIGVHESTASRVTSNKYIHTPRGIFELKYFFSSSLSASDSGETLSAEAVKYKIRKLVNGESPRHPYSDEKLARFLEEQGVVVARRTIAKYREAMGIPSSSRRKQLEA